VGKSIASQDLLVRVGEDPRLQEMYERHFRPSSLSKIKRTLKDPVFYLKFVPIVGAAKGTYSYIRGARTDNRRQNTHEFLLETLTDPERTREFYP
jgi:hypothetical protein